MVVDQFVLFFRVPHAVCCSFGQQGHRLLWVIGIGRHLVIRPAINEGEGVPWFAQAEVYGVPDFLAVDSVAYGHAHALVPESRLTEVADENTDVVQTLCLDIDTGQILCLLIEVAFDLHQVQFTLLESDELRVGRAHVLEQDAIEAGGALPVVVVARQAEVLILFAVDKLEGTGADLGLGREPEGVAGVLQIGHAPLAVDVLGQDVDTADKAGEVAYVRFGEGEADGEIVDHFDSLDRIGFALQIVQRTFQRNPVTGLGGVHPGAVRVVVPSPGEGHVIGGEVLSVVPLYALSEVESELGGVIADLPAFGQIGVGNVVGAGADQLAEDEFLLLVAPTPDGYYKSPGTEVKNQSAAACGANIVPGRCALCRRFGDRFRGLVGGRRYCRGTGDRDEGQNEKECNIPVREHALPPLVIAFSGRWVQYCRCNATAEVDSTGNSILCEGQACQGRRNFGRGRFFGVEVVR